MVDSLPDKENPNKEKDSSGGESNLYRLVKDALSLILSRTLSRYVKEIEDSINNAIFKTEKSVIQMAVLGGVLFMGILLIIISIPLLIAHYFKINYALSFLISGILILAICLIVYARSFRNKSQGR